MPDGGLDGAAVSIVVSDGRAGGSTNRPGRSRPNLNDIAQRLGLSPSTVSRGLRKLQGVRSETIEKIHRAAADLGYRHVAPLQGQEKHWKVLALSQVSNWTWDSEFMVGLSHAAVGMNMSLLSHHCRLEQCESLMDPRRQPLMMRERSVDGIVLMHRWPEEVVAHLESMHPLVSLVHSYPGVDVVTSDDALGMQQIVEHLRNGGVRRIGFFGLCPEMSWSLSRFSAYAGAVAASGEPLRGEDVISVPLEAALSETPFAAEEAFRKAREGVQAGVEAWVCPSQMIAVSLLGALLEAGIKVPAEVAVTGFHAASGQMPRGLPQLTSTAVPSQEIGAAALRRLYHRMTSGELLGRKILLPCSLCRGETTRSDKPESHSSRHM